MEDDFKVQICFWEIDKTLYFNTTINCVVDLVDFHRLLKGPLKEGHHFEVYAGDSYYECETAMEVSSLLVRVRKLFKYFAI